MSDDLLTRMQALAHASGKTVIIGCYSHRDDWFAHCDGTEWQGATPDDALDSVARTLIENADKQISDLESARSTAARLRGI